MLEKSKKKILAFLTKMCKDRQSVLISPADLSANLNLNELKEEGLEKKVVEQANLFF